MHGQWQGEQEESSVKLRSLQSKLKDGFLGEILLAFQNPQVADIPHPASLLHQSSHGNEAAYLTWCQSSPGAKESGTSVAGCSHLVASRVNPLMAGLVRVIQVVKWVLTFFPFLPPCVSCLKLDTWLKRGLTS